MTEAYENVNKAPLKLKGQSLSTKKKKKKKSPALVAAAFKQKEEEEVIVEPAGPTTAELKFAMRQARVAENRKIKQVAEKTHRERIEEFNQKLADLSEHYDIPKVGPG